MTRTHGQAAGNKTPTYETWRSMWRRCRNRSNKRFQHYGGRGVTVCPRWESFESFLADMGERPEGKTLDRYPNKDGNYEPGNCRWATSDEQARNRGPTRMLTHQGETLCLRDWERRLGLGYGTLWRRIAKGETVPHCMRAPDPKRSASARSPK